MGWNRVEQSISHPLWVGIGNGSRFYFVHSYYAPCAVADEVVGVTCYGVEFASAAARKNVFAVQFHPEKSHRHGLTLLANFVRWAPARGAYRGLIGGMTSVTTVALTSEISFLWLNVVGALAVFLVGITISALQPS